MTGFLQEIQRTTHRANHQTGSAVVDAQSLTLRFETGVALQEVTFRLEAGERVAVVGPNGAGKSTLFKLIAGVLSPSSGKINVYGQGPDGHICISYLPQRSHVDWNFPVNVADVVMMGRIGKLGWLKLPKRKDWDLVRNALQQVDLAELATRQIGELSGGQQQRMFIARALAQEAELMLMDEPLTGLDAKSEEIIYQILDVLRQRGITVMIATHDLDQAAQRFDRVMLLNRRLLGFGHPQEVFTPEKLMAAYGSHLHLIQGEGEMVLVGDTCCEPGEAEQ
jgi:manganese/iron transport system ATP-binding protein